MAMSQHSVVLFFFLKFHVYPPFKKNCITCCKFSVHYLFIRLLAINHLGTLIKQQALDQNINEILSFVGFSFVFW